MIIHFSKSLYQNSSLSLISSSQNCQFFQDQPSESRNTLPSARATIPASPAMCLFDQVDPKLSNHLSLITWNPVFLRILTISGFSQILFSLQHFLPSATTWPPPIRDSPLFCWYVIRFLIFINEKLKTIRTVYEKKTHRLKSAKKEKQMWDRTTTPRLPAGNTTTRPAWTTQQCTFFPLIKAAPSGSDALFKRFEFQKK